MSDLFTSSGAWISPDGELRFKLWRIWDPAKGLAAWLGLNPSTADAEHNDPSVCRMIHFTRFWGLGGFVLVNEYPCRTPDPAEARRWSHWEKRGPDLYARDALAKNLDVIEEVGRQAALRIVAFGAGTWDEQWTAQCLEAFGQPSDIGADERLYCIGTNADGSPKHPMARGRYRVPDNQHPLRWREQMP